MKKWEYKVVSTDSPEVNLAGFGAEGWELVQAVHVSNHYVDGHGSHDESWFTLFFKRPVMESIPAARGRLAVVFTGSGVDATQE